MLSKKITEQRGTQIRMTIGNDYKNPEGYPDPTAYKAINNVEKSSPEDKERFRKLLNTIFATCELAGFQY